MTIPASPRPVRALLVEGVHPVAADLLAACGIAVDQVDRVLDPTSWCGGWTVCRCWGCARART